MYHNKTLIFGKRFYWRLVPNPTKKTRALLSDHPNVACHLVISYTNREGNRLYAYFDSYLEFFTFFSYFAEEDRCFYEVIFGDQPQKPHFDVDVGVDDFTSSHPNDDWVTCADGLTNALMETCVTVLRERGVELDPARDILLYTSHSNAKRSYHVVITNYCHASNQDARGFYDMVIFSLFNTPFGKYSEYVDRSVYSPKQQFRIVGCQKTGSGRPKLFNNKFILSGREIEHIYPEPVTSHVVLYESLVSFSSGCTMLPPFLLTKRTTATLDTADLPTEMVEQALTLLAATAGLTPDDRRFPYRLDKVQGNRILLKRLRPSLCPLCNRTHEHENPYMFVSSSGLAWHCRRAPSSTWLIVDTNTKITTTQDSANPDDGELFSFAPPTAADNSPPSNVTTPETKVEEPLLPVLLPNVHEVTSRIASQSRGKERVTGDIVPFSMGNIEW